MEQNSSPRSDKKPTFAMEKWFQQKPSDGPWPEITLQRDHVEQCRQVALLRICGQMRIWLARWKLVFRYGGNRGFAEDEVVGFALQEGAS
jgi:hypothetical protein